MNYIPLHLNPITFFGFIILIGLLGGEICQRFFHLPKISGYILSGFVLGPGAFHIIDHASYVSTDIFIEIALGFVLFNLGRYLDFTWLRYDKGLIFISLAESSLTFVLVFAALFFFTDADIASCTSSQHRYRQLTRHLNDD